MDTLILRDRRFLSHDPGAMHPENPGRLQAVHDDLDACLNTLGRPRVLACSTRGGTLYSEHRFEAGDALLFGPETRGLPQDVLDAVPSEQVLRIPMRSESRSLNLSNSAAVVVYEAWRQVGFSGLS